MTQKVIVLLIKQVIIFCVNLSRRIKDERKHSLFLRPS